LAAESDSKLRKDEEVLSYRVNTLLPLRHHRRDLTDGVESTLAIAALLSEQLLLKLRPSADAAEAAIAALRENAMREGLTGPATALGWMRSKTPFLSRAWVAQIDHYHFKAIKDRFGRRTGQWTATGDRRERAAPC
jgi:GGDEF domain-containing protein